MNIPFGNEPQIAIDFSKMEQKPYQSVDQFEDDMKWFQHNFRTCFPRIRPIQEASEKLIQTVKEQIHIINACEECFEIAYDKLYVPNAAPKHCSKPHVLVWAKLDDFRYAPAKVKTVNVVEKTVHIQYFGDYTSRILRCSDCYLYSTKNPDGVRGFRPKTYTAALKVS